MKNKSIKTSTWFKYVIVTVVLLIPFMYSFFYLKAYWNPYGKGNIDNLPVAIVNNDKGDKGNELIKNIKDSKKLKLSVTSSKKAEDGLNDGKYYAIINIPDDFTSNMESASSNNKRHATITYSPNQKSNYLSSQIINTVVLTVEKNLDNAVNSAIVDNLSNNVESIPTSLKTISDGFEKLGDGTNKLQTGTTTLADNYVKFNDGVKDIKNGSKSIDDGSKELNSGINNAYNGSKKILDGVNSSINDTKNSEAIDVATLNYIKNQATTEAKSQINQTQIKQLALSKLSTNTTYQNLKNGISQLESNGITKALVDKCTTTPITPGYENICSNNATYITQYSTYSQMINLMEETAKETAYSTASTVAEQVASDVSESVAKQVATTAKNKTVSSLTTLTKGLEELTNGLDKLNTGSYTLYGGAKTLSNGTQTLYDSSLKLQSGISTLTTGTKTLNSSVSQAKNELDTNIDSTKNEVKKVEKLSDYSKGPIKVKTKEVNKISSYGTAFSPLFISIALWVGSLMLFMVLYFDKEGRFGILGVDSKKRCKRTLLYHGLATLSGIVLGILLQLLLDFDITNIFLYYICIILVSNCFLAIIDFLIENFGDVGKFIALIILVLQLGASGGTFPIETVTKGFRFLNPVLPMTYTIKLLKEALVSIESNLLTKYFLIVFLIFTFFFVINIVQAYIKEKKAK